MNKDLFQNKYKINSPRLLGKDYSDDGKYFITICTKDRKMFFGDIINGKMILNGVGLLVDKFWQEIPNHFKDVRILDYVIIPNHAHGIMK